ncbi:Ff.00g021730.m01.CDS01 [Fusarium sp. VM40]|nr:Ff.00g021730.m01.CDS01 [Fusarium sp. VM40]
MLRSNSEYSLQDLSLSNRAGPRLRPSQTREHSDTDRNSNGEGSAVPQTGNDSTSTSGESKRKRKTRLGRFWQDYVSCEVDLSASRDHLANERTFLGYLRTSVMMSMVGTMVAQLFTLHHEGYHVHGFGYFVTGKPLALTCYAFSIGTILLGAVRTWRHQQIMMRGKALVGGFEIHLLGIFSMLLILVFFSLLLGIDVSKESQPEPTTSS